MKSIVLSFCVAILLFSFSFLNASPSFSNDLHFIEKYDNRSFDEIVITEPLNTSFSDSDQLQFNEDELPATSIGEGEINNLFKSVFGESDDDNIFTKINKITTPEELKNVSLPAGIFINKDRFGIKIAIIKAYFAPEYIQMDMLAEITWPNENGGITKLRLGAWNVRSYYNEGWKNEVKFLLLEDATIPLGEYLALYLNGCGYDPNAGSINKDKLSNATYFNIDCNGIEHAKVLFRGKIKVIGEDLKIYNVTKNSDGTFDITDKTFEIDFNVEGSLGNLYFELATAQPHYFTYDNSDIIVGFEGFTVDADVNKTNPDLFKSRSESGQPHIIKHFENRDINNEWKGLYITNISLYFPDKLTSDTERFMIESNNLVIDEKGIAFGLEMKSGLGDLNFQRNLPVKLTSIELQVSESELNCFNIGGRVSPAFLEEGHYLSFGYGLGINDSGNDQIFSIFYDDITDKGKDETTHTSFIPAKINSFSCEVSIPAKPYNENNYPKLTIGMNLQTTGKLKGLTLKVREDDKIVYNLHNNSFVKGTAIITIVDDPDNEDPNFNNFPIASSNSDESGNTFSAEAKFNPSNNIDLKLFIVLSTKGNDMKIGGSGSFTFDYSPKIDKNGDARFINSLTVSEIQVGIKNSVFAFNGGVRFYDPIKDAGRSGFSGNVEFAMATTGELKDKVDGKYASNVIAASASIEFGTQETANGVVFNYWALTASVIGLRIDIVPSALVATG
ncbi:MAG TPA: hypothetical protein PLS94_05215, partial [Prolixibacteraceae bacterium]|nr:hypothetical protein [Prolixibacteraceae bacterium]